MAGEKFKLPSSSYEELAKIVKAYGPFKAPADLGEVSKLIGMDPCSGQLIPDSILDKFSAFAGGTPLLY